MSRALLSQGLGERGPTVLGSQESSREVVSPVKEKDSTTESPVPPVPKHRVVL